MPSTGDGRAVIICQRQYSYPTIASAASSGVLSVQNERRDLFSAAEKEVSKILMDNLLHKFILSRQYKAVVDLV